MPARERHADLHLAGNGLGVAGVEALAAAAAGNVGIATLDLSDNDLCAPCAGTWRSCRAARRRSRRCCSAATTPAQRAPPLLADALTNNGYLTALDLRMNGAGNEGVCLLADALKTNATLLRPGAAIDERR